MDTNPGGVNAMTLEVTIDETQNIVKFKNTGTRTEAVVAEGFEIVKNNMKSRGRSGCSLTGPSSRDSRTPFKDCS